MRCHENSEFLEDVFTMNQTSNHSASPEFLLGREPAVLHDQHTVTGNALALPYMVTEFNGHMFPTKLDRSGSAPVRARYALSLWCSTRYSGRKDLRQTGWYG